MRAFARALMVCCLAVAVAVPAFATCPASGPTLVSPTDGATVGPGFTTLNWDPVANATGYEVWIGLDGDPLTPIADTVLTQRVIELEPGRYVEWKVGAKAPSCPTQYSVHFMFETWCPTESPDLHNPPNGTVFTTGTEITFGWGSVIGAASYDFHYSPLGLNQWTIVEFVPQNLYTTTLPDGDWEWKIRVNFNGDCDPLYSEHGTFSVSANACDKPAPALLSPVANATVRSPVLFEWSDVGADRYRVYAKKSTDIAPALLGVVEREQLAALLDPGEYEWGVVAEFESCPDKESERRPLTVSEGGACPADPGEAQLLSPEPNATNLSSPVTFQWQPVADATGYRVIASFGGGDPVTLGVTQETSLSADVPAGNGIWLVQSFFGEDCPTTLSDRRAFTVTTGATCNDAPPQLLSPPNGATEVDSPVELRWSEVPDAEAYLVFAAPGDDDFAFYGETEETSITRFVPPGTTIRWFVVAVLPACPELKSSVSTFQTKSSGCPDATITINTPGTDAVVQSPVQVSWTAVANATAYRVWVSVDGDAPVAILRTEQTSALIKLPAGFITLYVDALRPNCEPVVSAQRDFKVAERADCATNQAPALVSPVGTQASPAQVTNPVTLTWSAVQNAIGYRVWVGEDGRAFQDIALTKETSVTANLLPDEWGWFVQALFEGCEPEKSAIAFFEIPHAEERCNNDAPVVITPGAGEVLTGTAVITWTEVADAEKYRVFGSLDGGEPILLGITSETSLERALPPGQIAIAVEVVFSECPSLISQRVNFTVAEAQNCSDAGAELVSPDNDATDVASEVEFTWLPVSGAVKYVLVVQINDGAPTPIASTEDTHVTRTLPAGHVTWKVVAFFAGCDPVESDAFEFDIKRPQDGCPQRKPILVFPDGRFDVFAPVRFIWIGVPNATGYNVWAARQNEQPSIIAATDGATETSVDLPPGTYNWFVEATFGANCDPQRSADDEFTVANAVACDTPGRPIAQVVGQAQSNTQYRVRWTMLPNVGLYEVQESTTSDFENATTFTTDLNSMEFSHEAPATPVKYLYRVRGVSNCNDQRGQYSEPVSVFILPLKSTNASVEIGGTQGVVQKVFVRGEATPQQFTATADKPWITITPSSGTIPPEGITLTVTADPRVLVIGTNTATISIQTTSASNGVQTHGTTLSIPTSVSLVTPVVPSGKGTPPPDALIFPVVGHAAGANDSLFESDIRVTNLSAQTMKYQINFTPSGVDGTQTGSSSTVEIEPNQTMALDDIVASLFGTGTVSSAVGMLEVRPLTTTSSSSSSLFTSVPQTAIKALTTAASSRTYNFTPSGTFGQFIPAIRFDQFVGKAAAGASTILSLQQVAQSAAYRANFGFAEASGQPVDLHVRVYDTANQLLKTIPVSLLASEHKQINGMLSANGITDLKDGRVEVEVMNGSGKVTAYVSEVDNLTNDPLLVSAVPKGAVTANRYVVPGVAYINTGFAFWVTDLRVFNAGTAPTPATLTFYPQGNPGAAVTRDITVDPGEIEVLDNVIGGLFAQANGAGGSIAITTPANTTLTASARTYNQTSNGTYGQFIPGVTPAESVGLGDRALQILQMEQSSRFRANIGLCETSGQPVTIEVSAILPDSLVTPVVQINLAANEFRQISLADFGLSNAYNVRVTIKVTSGTGRVTGYGSAIDLITQDPTYVPAL